MKTDFYTKTTLTIIAVCLLVITFRQTNLFPEARANTAQPGTSTDVRYGLVPLNADGSIDVTIVPNSSKLDVNLVDINTSDKLNVNIDEVGGFSTMDALPVKIK